MTDMIAIVAEVVEVVSIVAETQDNLSVSVPEVLVISGDGIKLVVSEW